MISGRSTEGGGLGALSSGGARPVNSPEIKKRFQHELDLWLKRSYLKKEWKSAEFVNGALKKKS